MNLLKITDIGRERIFVNALVEDENSNFKHKSVVCFEKFIPKDYEINTDNISYIKRFTYPVGTFKKIDNPLHKHWFDIEEKYAYLFKSEGTIEVIAIHMNDGTIFYIDGNDDGFRLTLKY